MKKYNFEDLYQPEQDFDSTVGNNWIVVSKLTSYLILLNDNRYALGDIDDYEPENFYFATELDAHEQACIYYTRNQRLYPYANEYSRIIIPTSAAKEDNQQSIKMEFV